MSRLFSLAVLAALAITPFSAAHADQGRKKALATGAAAGLAAGVLGGVLLDRTLLNGGQPAAPAAAQPEYDPQPTYSNPRATRAAPAPYVPRMSGLKSQCDEGDTRACIRFGILIGQHREQEAQLRRQNPDWFDYERN